MSLDLKGGRFQLLRSGPWAFFVAAIALSALAAVEILAKREPVTPTAAFSVEESCKDLGQVALGRTHEIVFRIANTGDRSLQIIGGLGT